jgi:hypothetical protein
MARRMVSEMMRPAVVCPALAKALAAANTSSSKSRVVRITTVYLMRLHQVRQCLLHHWRVKNRHSPTAASPKWVIVFFSI